MPWPKPDLWHHGYAPASDRCQATGGPGDFTATGPAPADRCLYPPTKVVVENIVTFPPRNASLLINDRADEPRCGRFQPCPHDGRGPGCLT